MTASTLLSLGPVRQRTLLDSFPRVLLSVVFLPHLLVFSKVLSFSLYPVFSLDNLVHFNNWSETSSLCQQLPDPHTCNPDPGVPLPLQTTS